jgi:hypothetical protein
MTKKSRVNQEAFGWVDSVVDTKDQATEQPKPAETKKAARRKTVEKKATQRKSETTSAEKNDRLLVVAYKNENGDIMASQELTFDAEGNGNISWSGISKDTTVKVFKLIGELADKEIIEIHRNYKVTGSGKLELKSR